MKRRRQLGVISALCLVAVAAAFFVMRPREPVYQGKQLSQWLEEFNRVGPAEINQEAEKAIRQIGTNALPFLVKDLCSRDSPFKLSLMKLSMKWSPIKFHFRPAEDRHGPARMGFYVLGTAGKLGPAAIPFLPALGKLLKTEPYGAALALLYCGEESIPYLTDSLSDPN